MAVSDGVGCVVVGAGIGNAQRIQQVVAGDLPVQTPRAVGGTALVQVRVNVHKKPLFFCWIYEKEGSGEPLPSQSDQIK